MRYSTILEFEAERDVLLAKKRLGKNQKARLAELSDRIAFLPPATPRRAPTGERGDFQGNVYEAHRINRFGAHGHLRNMRRAKASGQIQPMRSRIQRGTRRQRTGGVR